MKLFIGGYAQGKNKYAQARFPGYAFLDEKNYDLGVGIMNWGAGPIENPVEEPGEETGKAVAHSESEKAATHGILVNHLHRIIRKELEDGRAEEEIREEILRLGRQPFEVVFLCDELGNGIVPIDPDEREWREVVGHILIAVAAEANEVLRIFCGIPEVIKKDVK